MTDIDVSGLHFNFKAEGKYQSTITTVCPTKGNRFPVKNVLDGTIKNQSRLIHKTHLCKKGSKKSTNTFDASKHSASKIVLPFRSMDKVKESLK